MHDADNNGIIQRTKFEYVIHYTLYTDQVDAALKAQGSIIMLCYVRKHVPVRKAAAQFDIARNHHGSFSRVSLPGVSPRSTTSSVLVLTAHCIYSV